MTICFPRFLLLLFFFLVHHVDAFNLNDLNFDDLDQDDLPEQLEDAFNLNDFNFDDLDQDDLREQLEQFISETGVTEGGNQLDDDALDALVAVVRPAHSGRGGGERGLADAARFSKKFPAHGLRRHGLV